MSRFSSLDSAGLTLMEVIIAFVVLGIASLGLFAIGSQSTSGNTRNASQVAASSLVIAKLEELRNTDFDLLAGGSDGPLTAKGQAGGIYSRSWSVTSTTISGVSTPAKILSATVTWNAGTVSMTTMVVKPSQAFTDISPGLDSGFPTVAMNATVQTR